MKSVYTAGRNQFDHQNLMILMQGIKQAMIKEKVNGEVKVAVDLFNNALIEHAESSIELGGGEHAQRLGQLEKEVSSLRRWKIGGMAATAGFVLAMLQIANLVLG